MTSKYPVMLYDGDCKFCKHWITRWSKLTHGKVSYLPYQDNINRFPQIRIEDCQKAVQFIDVDGSIYSAAEGVLRSLLYSKKYAWSYRFYKKNKLFAIFAEWLYKLIAKNRKFLN